MAALTLADIHQAEILRLCDEGEREKTIELLKKVDPREDYWANVRLRDEADNGTVREFTAAMRAAAAGHLELFNDLVATGGAKIDAVAGKDGTEGSHGGQIANAGATVLFYAAQGGNLAIVCELLERDKQLPVRKKDVATVCGQRWFALTAAAAGNHAAVVKALLIAAFEKSIAEAAEANGALSEILQQLAKKNTKQLYGGETDPSDLRRKAYALGMDLDELDDAVGLDEMLTTAIDFSNRDSSKGWEPEDGPPLLAAVNALSTDSVRLLLSCGAERSLPQRQVVHPYWQPLYKAATLPTGLGVVKALLEGGVAPNPTANGETGTTALHAAVEKGCADVVDALLRAGAHVDHQKKSGDTALFVAVWELVKPTQDNDRRRCRRKLELLLAHGANVELPGQREEKGLLNSKVALSPLELVCTFANISGNVEIAELLVRTGSRVNEKDLNARGALYKRLVEADKLSDKVLRQSSVNLKSKSRVSMLPEWVEKLKTARTETSDESSEMLRNLLGFDAKHRHFFAVQSGNRELVEHCLKLDNILDDSGQTMLTVEYSGYTPFHLACLQGHVDIVRLLAEQDSCETEKLNCHGQTGWDIVLESRRVVPGDQGGLYFDEKAMEDLDCLFNKYATRGDAEEKSRFVKEKEVREGRPQTKKKGDCLKIQYDRLHFQTWDMARPQRTLFSDGIKLVQGNKTGMKTEPVDAEIYIDHVGMMVLVPPKLRRSRSADDAFAKRGNTGSKKVLLDVRLLAISKLETRAGTKDQISMMVLLAAGEEKVVLEADAKEELGQLLAKAIAWARGGHGANWKTLSAGAFGVVYIVSSIFPPLYQGDTSYATAIVKAVKSTGAGASAAEEIALTSEIETLATLSHKHIVTALGFTYGSQPGALQEDKWMLLLEQCNCDLGYIIYGLPNTPVGEMVRLAKEVADGMQYIHATAGGYLHLDLKPGNVLIKAEGDPTAANPGVARIADFGMAAKEPAPDQMLGTPEYMSPEAYHRKNGAIGKWSDVFSFGIILWEMLVMHRPSDCFPTAVPADPHSDPPTANMKLVPAWMSDPKSGQRPTIPAVNASDETEVGNCAWPLSQLIQACWHYQHEHEYGTTPTDRLKGLARASDEYRSLSDGDQAEENQLWEDLSAHQLGRALDINHAHRACKHNTGYLQTEQVHAVENQNRPTFGQIREVLEILQSIGEEKWHGDDEQEVSEPAVEPTYDDFLAQVDLLDRKEELVDYLSPGAELVELLQMEEDDLKEDILDDLALDEEQQTKCLAALAKMRDDKTAVENGQGWWWATVRSADQLPWERLVKWLQEHCEGSSFVVDHLDVPGKEMSTIECAKQKALHDAHEARAGHEAEEQEFMEFMEVALESEAQSIKRIAALENEVARLKQLAHEREREQSAQAETESALSARVKELEKTRQMATELRLKSTALAMQVQFKHNNATRLKAQNVALQARIDTLVELLEQQDDQPSKPPNAEGSAATVQAPAAALVSPSSGSSIELEVEDVVAGMLVHKLGDPAAHGKVLARSGQRVRVDFSESGGRASQWLEVSQLARAATSVVVHDDAPPAVQHTEDSASSNSSSTADAATIAALERKLAATTAENARLAEEARKHQTEYQELETFATESDNELSARIVELEASVAGTAAAAVSQVEMHYHDKNGEDHTVPISEVAALAESGEIEPNSWCYLPGMEGYKKYEELQVAQFLEAFAASDA